ncbi:hypothetical protein MKEN_00409900 [Mycena kentingensis (nom. inval.)]|nr:hypothetical protein MKEN_00409900 [Mycena kentingensis (nom. inval.)]
MPGAESEMGLLTLEVASLVLETLLYGVFFVLCMTTGYLRLWARGRPQAECSLFAWGCGLLHPVMVATLALFVLCTTHWAISVARFFRGLLVSPTPAEFTRYLAEDSQKTFNMNNCLNLLITWVGDMVLTYRLWVIWNRRWPVLVFPITILLCLIAVETLLISKLLLPLDKYLVFWHGNRQWYTVSWGLSLTMNVYCTGFTACRILSACRASGAMAAKPFLSVLAVLVESAAILIAWTLAFGIVYERRSPLLIVVANLVGIVVGLVNMLVYVRVELSTRDIAGRTVCEDVDIVMTNNASLFGVELELPQTAPWASGSGSLTLERKPTGGGASGRTW